LRRKNFGYFIPDDAPAKLLASSRESSFRKTPAKAGGDPESRILNTSGFRLSPE